MNGLPPLARDTITIQTPQFVTDHGARVPDWARLPADTRVVQGCSVQPAGGSEDRLHRTQIGAQFTLFAPAGVAIAATDRVWVTGYAKPLRIAAEPARWSPGFLNHIEVDLVAWEG